MTNTRIIKDAAVSAGLYTEAEALDLIAKIGALPIHTFAEWKRLGYSVKKGEKACLHLYLWKFTNKPNKDERDKAADTGEELEDDPHYYKKYSHLFHLSQVRRTNAPEPETITEPEPTEPAEPTHKTDKPYNIPSYPESLRRDYEAGKLTAADVLAELRRANLGRPSFTEADALDYIHATKPADRPTDAAPTRTSLRAQLNALLNDEDQVYFEI